MNTELLKLFTEQREWMEVSERTRRRRFWWAWAVSILLRPLVDWISGCFTGLFS